MNAESEAVINEAVGLTPVAINSALVSAQNRLRLYWTNIKTASDGLFGDLHTAIPEPADRGIAIHDILEDSAPDKFVLGVYQRGRGYVKTKIHRGKSPTLTAKYWADNNPLIYVSEEEAWRSSIGIIQGFTDPPAYRPMVGNKSPTLLARARQDGSGQPCLLNQGVHLRLLTPTECARLQTIPDWYKWGCSDAQAYKMLGNGWTVEVIKHILSFINPE